MAERVKIYEEKKKAGVPFWIWLLPLLLIAAAAYYLLNRHPAQSAAVAAPIATAAPAAAASAPAAFPDLGTVHFDTDKATLTPDGQATLDKAADAMKNDPSVHLRLEGFTDSTGTAPHNLSLSEQRANTVGQYLKSKGIDGNRLTGDGFAATNPVDTNQTAAGKADNRRVELFSQK